MTVNGNAQSVTTGNRLARVVWTAVWAVLFRPSPAICFGWRRMLLRAFGARVEAGVHVYPSCRIWAPWNLTLRARSCLARHVDCYNVAPVTLGADSIVSQYSYLCTASHDVDDPAMPLIAAPITIGERAWVCADVFVGPGVRVGDGGVVGARSSAFKDLPPWMVCAGSPAKPVRARRREATT